MPLFRKSGRKGDRSELTTTRTPDQSSHTAADSDGRQPLISRQPAISIHPTQTSEQKDQIPASADDQSRYASDNDGLDEMDSLCRDPQRTDLKSLVKQDSEVTSGPRFSEHDLEAHFRGSEYARPHEPLRPVSTKKKKRKPEDGGKREDESNQLGGDDGALSSRPRTSSTAEDALPAFSSELTSGDLSPVKDERAAHAGPPINAHDRVKFHIGQGEVDYDEEAVIGDEDGGHERRGRRHHHRQIHVEDPSDRRQLGSERKLRSAAPSGSKPTEEDNDELEMEITSHRYEDGPRVPRLVRKEDRTISNVVHLGDVNTGQTMILGKKSVDHTPHDMFVELDELTLTENELEWKETARWIKYEEDVEQEGNRWGKPHLASLSFQSLMSLRRCLEKGVILLDVEDHDSVAISHRIAQQLLCNDMIKQRDFGSVMRTLLLRRQHVGEGGGRGIRGYMSGRNLSRMRLQSLGDIGNNSQPSLHEISEKKQHFPLSTSPHRSSIGGGSITSDPDVQRFMSHHNILRRMAAGTEVVSVNVGRVDFVDKPTAALVRLDEGTFLPGITEVPLPVRFIFFFIVPNDSEENVHETGRAFATIMSSSVFHDAAYRATCRTDLLWGFKEFLDETLVLPPISWTNPDVLDVHELQRQSRELQERRIERQKQQRQALAVTGDRSEPTTGQNGKQKDGGAGAGGGGAEKKQKDAAAAQGDEPDGDGDKEQYVDDPLVRVGKPFAGLIRDIKRRYPFYLSDFKEGLNVPVFSATFFIFFAALAGAITFGGLMMDKTNLQIGISETLISTAAVGIMFSLFSCQPLIIVGTTGPVLLFDEALFKFANSNNLEFLPMRIWIAFWMLVVSLVVVGLEGSVFVKKFTLFTTEIFSSLVSVLFVFESLSKLATVFGSHRLLADYCNDISYAESLSLLNISLPGTNLPNYTIDYTPRSLQAPLNQPNTAYLSMLLMFGTFFIADYLRQFRNSKFLSRRVRRMLGDFGVPIAILLMVGLDQLMPMVYTQRLQVPSGLTPSNSTYRGWFISPLGLHQSISWLTVVGALPAAMLIFIVIYMETMVCQLIMAKPERNLRKGTGFHWDIVLLSALNLASSLIGAPWMCAATIRSVSHAAALSVLSTTYAPGETPRVVGVHEQRLSTLLVSILIGLSVVLSFVLKQIPIAVIFGIFMYMGISSMTGVQLLERCVLFLMPVKHHPEEVYVKRVRTWRMHLFTLIQLVCLGFLLAIKFTPAAIGFPFFLALLVPLRLYVLPKLFTTKEIAALDGGKEVDDEDDADFYEEAHQMPSAMSVGNFQTNFSMSSFRLDGTSHIKT